MGIGKNVYIYVFLGLCDWLWLWLLRDCRRPRCLGRHVTPRTQNARVQSPGSSSCQIIIINSSVVLQIRGNSADGRLPLHRPKRRYPGNSRTTARPLDKLLTSVTLPPYPPPPPLLSSPCRFFLWCYAEGGTRSRPHRGAYCGEGSPGDEDSPLEWHPVLTKCSFFFSSQQRQTYKQIQRNVDVLLLFLTTVVSHATTTTTTTTLVCYLFCLLCIVLIL